MGIKSLWKRLMAKFKSYDEPEETEPVVELIPAEAPEPVPDRKTSDEMIVQMADSAAADSGERAEERQAPDGGGHAEQGQAPDAGERAEERQAPDGGDQGETKAADPAAYEDEAYENNEETWD